MPPRRCPMACTKHRYEFVGTRLRGAGLPVSPWARPAFSAVVMVEIVVDDNSIGVSARRYHHR
jgi:hypothetical protein